MRLKYDDIYNRCKDISSYEGGRIVDASGESMFSVVKLTDQDKPLVTEYANNAALIIDKLIHFAIVETEINKRTFDKSTPLVYYNCLEITFVDDSTLHGDCDDINETIESIIVSFVMWHWLSDKSETRSQVWQNIYTEMLKALPKGISRKRPKLDI